LGEFHATYYRIPGQFFVATRALLFYSNWLGFERRFCLTFSDIETIQSHRTTSIKISMVDCEEYVFKKFQDRDVVVQVLRELLMRYQLEVEKGQDLLDPPSIPRAFQQSTIGSTTHGSPLSAMQSSHVIPAPSDTPQELQVEETNKSVILRRPHLSFDYTHELEFGHEEPNRIRSLSVPAVIGHDTREQLTPVTSTPTRSTNRSTDSTLCLDTVPNPPTESFQKKQSTKSIEKSDHRCDLDITLSRTSPEFLTCRSYNKISGHEEKAGTHTLSGGACHEVLAHSISTLPQASAMSDRDQCYYSKLFDVWLEENRIRQEIALEPTEVDVSPVEFFDLFFHDSAPYSLSRYQQEQIGDKDVRFSSWTVHSSPATDVHFLEREIDYIHPLTNAIGPSEAKTLRNQKLWQYGNVAVVIQNTTDVEGIPMADCFQVHDQWIVKTTNKNDSVTLSVSFHVEFVKRTIFKKLIQSNVKAETKKWFQGYVQMLRRAVKESKEAGGPSVQCGTLDPEVLQESAESLATTNISEQNTDKACDVEILEENGVNLDNRDSIFAATKTLLRHFRSFDVDVLSKLALFGFLFVLVLQMISMQTTLQILEKHLLDLELQNNLLLQELRILTDSCSYENHR
jgi:hypothetical protein